MQAAAVLPLIAALTLICGRRGNSSLCFYGSMRLMGFELVLGISGPVWIATSYLVQILPYHATLAQMCTPLFQPAGMAWSLSLLVWLVGWLSGWQALVLLRNLKPLEKYTLSYVRAPLIISFFATLCFFAVFLLVNWPFAGLPESMQWDRALMAIWRHATTSWFMGFCPAAAILLAAWPNWAQSLAPKQMAITIRWFSFWSITGAIPSLFTNWGLTLGAAIGNARASAIAQGLHVQLYVLTLFTIAIGCWAILLWKPRYLHPLAWIALFLLLLKTCLPIIVAQL